MNPDHNYRQIEAHKLESIWNLIYPQLEHLSTSIGSTISDPDMAQRGNLLLKAINRWYELAVSSCFEDEDSSIQIQQILPGLCQVYKYYLGLIMEVEMYEIVSDELYKLTDGAVRSVSPNQPFTKYMGIAAKPLNTFRNQSVHWDFVIVNDPFYGQMINNYCNAYHLSSTLTLTAYALLEITTTWACHRGLQVDERLKCYNINDYKKVEIRDKKDDGQKDNTTVDPVVAK